MVKFRQYLLSAAEKAGIPSEYYFDYKALKKVHIKSLIKAKSELGLAPVEISYEFAETLAEQISRIQTWSQEQFSELSAKVDALVKEEETAKKKSKKSTTDYINEANALGEDCVRLTSYIALNRLAIDKIIKKHDKHAALAFKELFPDFFTQRKLMRITAFDAQILALSDFHAKIRGETVDKNVGVGTNFERQSIKYWVHPEDMMTVVMIIIQHLPVYSFKPDDAKPGEPGYARKCISDIKSTYYDNEDLFMYHTRMSREEGASLIRIRWYDDKDDTLFVERKIHHEMWVEDGSTKERFVLPSKKIDAFIAGTYKAEQFEETLKANPKLTQADIDYQRGLFEEVQARFGKYDLFPSVRTHYPRMAFQIPGDARVRVSLDLDVKMLSEWHCPPGHWRSEKPADEYCYNFPYGIMEVKLQGDPDEMPSWIKDLMKSKFCEAIPKFSKFGHGTATLHPDRCNVTPYWFDQMENRIESIYKPDEGSTVLYREFRPPAQASKTPQPVDRAISPRSPNTSFLGGSPRCDRSFSRPSSNDNIARLPSEGHIAGDSSDDEARAAGAGVGDNVPGVGVRQRKFAAKSIPWWQRDNAARDNVRAMAGALPAVRPKVRVEPKTYMANERTLLHWLSISSLVGMLSLSLVRTEARRSNPIVLLVGITAYGTALLCMVYALKNFFHRGKMIAAGEMVKFDMRGASVLTVMLMLVIAAGAAVQIGILGTKVH